VAEVPTLEGMNSPARAASLSGLMSLMADALDPEPPTARGFDTAEIAPLQPADLAAVLGQVVRGWLTMREDGHGWLLIQFAPGAPREPEPPAEHDERRTPSRVEVAARAQRVHTALTDREREVLSLVASGATNCAIAQRLFISPKTASVHVSRILTKLDAATRTEAAALAHAAGLVRPWGTSSAQELSPRIGPSLVHA
jgi:DNA-binding CsgD family transcriptional regulator